MPNQKISRGAAHVDLAREVMKLSRMCTVSFRIFMHVKRDNPKTLADVKYGLTYGGTLHANIK